MSGGGLMAAVTIRVPCKSCGNEIDTSSDKVRLHYCAGDENRDFYTFECPTCGPQRNPSNKDIRDLLVDRGGVRALPFVRERARFLPAFTLHAQCVTLGEIAGLSETAEPSRG